MLTSPGSRRTVSSMSPDQLARKRAADRKGQHASRERKKRIIEDLKREVQRLSSLQLPNKDAEALRKENQALRKEVDMLKSSMGLSVKEPLSSMHLGNSCPCIMYTATNLGDELMFLQISLISRPHCVGPTDH